jgi:TatD DNase family protein
MKYFDTHTHVNFEAFKDDRAATMQRAIDAGTWLINVGTQIDTSRSAAELAEEYQQGVFAAIGLHPVHTYQQMLDEEESHFQSRAEVFDAAAYEKLLNPKVVAVGEIGLDYFRLPDDSKSTAIAGQKMEFIKQLQFAKRHHLPVIIHCREAYDDVLEILHAEYAGAPGVIHSFTDTWATAKKFLDFGFYVALNGILTFDKTGKLAEVAQKTPLDRLLIETDAPYLTPPPFRGKRNEPAYVRYVAEKIAQCRQISPEDTAAATFANALALFQIKNR